MAQSATLTDSHMNGLELNKIAASVLLAGVIAMGTGIITTRLLYPGADAHHEGAEGEAKAKRGYTIAGAEAFEADGKGGAAAAEEKPVDIATFLAKADAAAGEATTKKCTTCHTFEKGGANKVGPNLWGILGGPVAHKSDYEYSQVFKDAHAKGQTWEWQHLSEYLTHPKVVMPNTKMAFAGIAKPEERANLLAYLNTLRDSPLPLPKPSAAAPEAAKEGKPGGQTEPAAAGSAKAKTVAVPTSAKSNAPAKADDTGDASPEAKRTSAITGGKVPQGEPDTGE